MKEQIQQRIAQLERTIEDIGWYDRSTANYTAGRVEAIESELHFLKSLVGK
jgi:hypothetical protein